MTRDEYLRQQLDRSYRSYLEKWDRWAGKGYAMKHGKPLTKDEFNQEYRQAIDAGERNIARDLAASQREVTYSQSQKIYIEYREAEKQLQKEIAPLSAKKEKEGLTKQEKRIIKQLKKELEEVKEKTEKYSTRTAALEAGGRKETFADYAALVGYKEAEEFFYPEHASRRSRHAESRLKGMQFF